MGRLLVSVIAVATALLATSAKAEEPFESYPHIRCEACLAITSEIGENMNKTNKVKTSVQASHRLEGGNERRIDYESSELRAVEILDRICDNFYNKYFLRVDKEGETPTRRFFHQDKALKRAPFYGKRDKAILGAPSRKLQQYCLQLMDESDAVFTKAIMKERTLDALQDTVCTKGLKVCGTKAAEKSLAKEAKYRAEHLKLKEKKRMKKLAAEKKKEEEEAAKEAAEEAARAAAAPPADESSVAGGEEGAEAAASPENSGSVSAEHEQQQQQDADNADPNSVADNKPAEDRAEL